MVSYAKNMTRHFNFRKLGKKFIIYPLVIFTVILIGLAYYLISLNGRVYPNLGVSGIDLSRLTPSEASKKLESEIVIPKKIYLSYQDQSFEIDTADIELSYDFQASTQKAYEYTRSGNFIKDLSKRISLLFEPQNLSLSVNINQEKLDKILSVISGQVSEKPIEPTVKIVKTEIIVDKGTPGRELNQNKIKDTIYQTFYFNTSPNIQIPVDVIDHTINDEEAGLLHSRAEKYVGKTIQTKFEYSNFNLNDNDILALLDPKNGYLDGKITEFVEKVSLAITRAPQNPKFSFEGGKVTEFKPSLEGIRLDKDQFRQLLINSLNTISNSEEKLISIDIPVFKTPPEISTDKVNNLGINQLIGRGTSTYYHSIPSRVHNVVLATSKINGTLVAPGETFSFNQHLGDVSQFTGYQQAYIISEGKTILGDGGGVCQVSTTLFRALLNAGLPITERRAHAYRVGYYEQGSPPGLDATVYSPSPDLKFTNDTPAHILIVATANPKNYTLVFELYGTSDGRVSTISKPIVTNVVAPPEDLYQDDPTLPVGTIKQIDYKAWGAKVTFNYTVKRGGETIISKTFTSNYKPWQAVYLRGTATQ